MYPMDRGRGSVQWLYHRWRNAAETDTVWQPAVRARIVFLQALDRECEQCIVQQSAPPAAPVTCSAQSQHKDTSVRMDGAALTASLGPNPSYDRLTG